MSAVDANIPLSIKPIELQDPLQRYGNVLAIQGQQQANALRAQQMQMQGAENAYTQQRRAGLNALLQGGAQGPELEQALRTGGYLPESIQLGEHMRKIAQTEAVTAKDRAEAQSKELDMHIKKNDRLVSLLNTANDQPSWTRVRDYLANDPEVGPDGVKSVPVQYDPQFAQTMLARTVPHLEQLKLQQQQTGQAITMRGQDIGAATARRGQDITQQTALSAREVGKVPPGYRVSTSGDLEAIPGGPADLKLQGQYNADAAALTGTQSGLDRLAISANELKNHPGVGGITGWRGKVPNAPGSDAANAEALLNTLKSQVAFGVLQDMRNNSKTGGALGAVSDKEGALLQSNLAALDKSQSQAQFDVNLQKIIDYVDAAKGRLQGAFNVRHAATPNRPQPEAAAVPNAVVSASPVVQTGTGPVQISNDDDYAKLPPGATYIAPDGSTRRKR